MNRTTMPHQGILSTNRVDRRLGPNQARFWLDWVEKPSLAKNSFVGARPL
jgi:hypothetical protein